MSMLLIDQMLKNSVKIDATQAEIQLNLIMNESENGLGNGAITWLSMGILLEQTQ